jgi:hypothetical protein
MPELNLCLIKWQLICPTHASSGGFLTPEQHRLSKIQYIGLHNEAVDLRGWGYGGVLVS